MARFIKLQIDRRIDQRGFTLYINNVRCLAFNYWRIWRGAGKTDAFGWLLQATLPSRVAHGSAVWASWPWWRRAVHPANWLRRTAFVAWRARGGQGPLHGPWPRLRAGYQFLAGVPYSFR